MKTNAPDKPTANPQCKQKTPAPPAYGKFGQLLVISVTSIPPPTTPYLYQIQLTLNCPNLGPTAPVGLTWNQALSHPPSQQTNNSVQNYNIDGPTLYRILSVSLTTAGQVFATLYAIWPGTPTH